MLPFLAFLLLICCDFASSVNEEGVALLSFKKSITLDPQLALTNWNISDETPCSWNGITCKENRVVSLSIPRKKLSGILSPSLGSLSELRHVNLRSNRLFGGLPLDLFKAVGLQSLVLYGNFLSGVLPFEVGNLDYLQRRIYMGTSPRASPRPRLPIIWPSSDQSPPQEPANPAARFSKIESRIRKENTRLGRRSGEETERSMQKEEFWKEEKGMARRRREER